MQIEDLISECMLRVNVENPFLAANNILGRAPKLGIVNVMKNEFLTNGPENIVSVEFVLSRHADDFSFAVLKVVMQGDQKRGFLDIIMETKTSTIVKESGFFSAAFADYYMERNYSGSSKKSRKLASDMEKRFEGIVKQMNA